MTKREKSLMIFVCGGLTAVTVTCIVLYALVADLGLFQALLLLGGCLLVLGAMLFTFLEVRRLARGSNRRPGPNVEEADPDASRVVVIEPPTGEPYPHHEHHVGSPGLDQGQLTSQLPDPPPWNLRDVWAQWIARRKDHPYRSKKPAGPAASH